MDLPIQVRHLLVCESVVYNPDKPGAAFTLSGLVVSIRPPDDDGYPLMVEQLSLFAQVYGTPGTYPAHADLYRVDETDGGVYLRTYDLPPIRLRAGKFVQGVTAELRNIYITAPGVYEFRVFLDGYDEPLAAERILLGSD